MKKFYLLMMFALLGMVANAQTFQKVTDVAQLAAGDKVVIVYENGADSKVMGASYSTGKYRTDVGVSISAEQFVAPEETAIFTLGKNSDGTFTFNDGTGYLEYHGASNELYTQASGDINWTVTNESIVNSNVTERYLQYNPSGKRFACYKLSSNQKNVCLYKETITTKVSAPEFSTAEGTYYNSLTIDISCATADASIFYTINDGAETAYEAPIELSESGEYTIKAWATKEGLENSEVVSKTYTLKIGEQPMSLELNIENYCTNAGIGNSDDLFEIIYNNVKFTATNGTSNPPKYYTSDKTWRIYVGASLTITAPDGFLVESVNINASKATISSVDSGTLDGLNWVASGNTQSVKFNIGGTTQIKSITVTLKEADSNQVAAPTFSLTSGTYEGTQSLALNCETEGATIYYTVNGGETQTYANDAIELTEGEYAFVAWAEKDGMTKSLEVTANYTIVAPLVANSIAEFLTLGAEYADREITLNCDLTVTYQGSTKEGNTTRDLYVQDKDGKGLLIFNFDNPQLKKGDVISGVKGKYDFYNGVPELIEPVLGEVKETVEVAPVSVDASQLTVDNVNDYVVINNVELSEVNGANATLNDETATLALYNKYNACTYPEEEELNKKYFVTGIVSVYKDAVQIYPLEITVDTESGVNDAVANEFKAVAVANGIEVNVAEAGLVSVYNAAGQLVANVNVAEGATTINVAGGFYIVKAGNNVAKVLVK